MEILSCANETVLQILKKFKQSDPQYRLLRYCVGTPVEDGVLLFNLLTRELLLLTEEESAHLMEHQYLKDHLFLVPADANEKEYADLVRWFLKTRKKKPKNIISYTIFPTTDCNARCFYCFELGRSRSVTGCRRKGSLCLV